MVPVSPSDWPIDRLPGLKRLDIEQLQAAGIETTAELLRAAAQEQGRKALALQLNLRQERINRWVALASLARIPAVGCEYCGVLLHAGTISPEQLATATPSILHRQIQRLHVATLRNMRACPTLADVELWIAQTKRM